MAHIPDGVLSVPVLAAGAALSLPALAYACRRLTAERIPTVAVFTAVFFVASLVHFPVGPASVHLILGGLTGVMLGMAALPAVTVGLLLQAVLFGFGGIAVLGVNIVTIGTPAVLCGLVFRAAARHFKERPQRLALVGGACGAGGVALTALLVAAALALSGEEYHLAAQLLVVSHLPVMGIEAVFTAAAVGFLLKLRPDLLGLTSEAPLPPAPEVAT